MIKFNTLIYSILFFTTVVSTGCNKFLDVKPEDKFVKPSNWTGSCADLQGLGSGYGDDGGLRTIDEIKNPKVPQNSTPAKSPGKKEDNVNENINTGDDIDFNQ